MVLAGGGAAAGATDARSGRAVVVRPAGIRGVDGAGAVGVHAPATASPG